MYLSDELSKRIVSSIRSAVPVEKIILFGSYARGEATKDSDVDLYLVVDPKNGPVSRQVGLARRSLLWMDIPRDVVANTAAGFKATSNDFAYIEHTVAREGQVLYGQ